MASTAYSTDNAAFTERAHETARTELYPALFGTQQLSFESTLLATSDRNRILDGEMAVDRIVKVTVRDLHAPLSFTVQERFRKLSYAKYKDLTITEFNHSSRLPSELYKMTCGLFLYGYFNEQQNSFAEAIAISVPDLLLKVARGDIEFSAKRNPRSNQTFFCFTFAALKAADTVRFHYANPRLFA